MSGAAGGSGDDVLDYSASTNTLVIFGDGSGGGGGGRTVGFTNNVVVGGRGGGGDDIITGGSGNDLIFGDGFNGGDTAGGVFIPGRGGLGGGGGGGGGGNFGMPPAGGPAGVCGGGGGAGTNSGAGGSLPIACGDSTAGAGATNFQGGNGGNAATPLTGSQGLGGAFSGLQGGGGGGFGGASGGSGVTAPTAGDTALYRIVDTGSAIRNYFTEAVLRSVFVNFPNYGAGRDVIDGKAGENELFGLGGNDEFIVDSADGAARVRIWDFSRGDKLLLKTNQVLISTVNANTYLSSATVGDYDNDSSSDDTRITFAGVPIDLLNTSGLTTDSTAEIFLSNNAPVLSIAGSSLPYTLSDSATAIDPSGTVSDADGDGDWNGGTMTAQITVNSTGSDALSLSGTNIEITGTTLKYMGNSVGVVSSSGGSVSGSTALTITFNAGATGAIVQTILNNFRFYTTGPGSSDRTVQITVVDKAGATINDSRVVAVTDPSIPTPTATPVPPTATPITPTATPITPTATPIPPTATPIPPTATPIPPTATPAPVTPTVTPVPTATPTPIPTGNSFSGTILNSSGQPAAGIVVYVIASESGTGILSAVTDTNGNYRFDDLPTGTYAILPSFTGLAFSPAQVSVGTGSTAPPITAETVNLNDQSCTRTVLSERIVAVDSRSRMQLEYVVGRAASFERLGRRLPGSVRTEFVRSLRQASSEAQGTYARALSESLRLPKVSLSCTASTCSRVDLSRALRSYRSHINHLRRLSLFVIRRARETLRAPSGESLLRHNRQVLGLHRRSLAATKRVPSTTYQCSP